MFDFLSPQEFDVTSTLSTHPHVTSAVYEDLGFTSVIDFDTAFASFVVKHPDMPGKVIKQVESTDEDGYHPFIRWVFANRMWEFNPHLPKVYSITECPLTGKVLYVLEELETYLSYRHKVQVRSDFDLVEDSMSFYKVNPQRRQQTLYQTCNALLDLFPSWEVDMHEQNVMVRGGNTIVITDPFSYLYEE